MKKGILCFLVLSVMLQVSVSQAQSIGIGSKVVTCYSCESCEAALQNGIVNNVKLIADIEGTLGNCIDVSQISNKVFNCDGHLILKGEDNPSYSAGFRLTNVSNIEIKNCYFQEWDRGITAWNMMNSSIHDNVIRIENQQYSEWDPPMYGIYFYGDPNTGSYSSYNQIYNNLIYIYQWGIYIYGRTTNNNFLSNTIVGYTDDPPTCQSGIYLSGDSNTLRSNDIANFKNGIEVINNDNVIVGNDVEDNQFFGINIFGDDNTIIENNIDYNQVCGIYLRFSSEDNYLFGNSVSYNGDPDGSLCDITAKPASGSSGNWGDENTCNTTWYYHDESVSSGCKYSY